MWYIESLAMRTVADEPGAATAIALRGVALHPESVTAHSTLAETLLAQGDSVAARSELARTIELAAAENDQTMVWRASRRLDAGIEVSEEVLQTYVGEYELSPTFSIAITLVDGGLYLRATGQQRFAVFAESEAKFFLRRVEAHVSFAKDDSGTVTGLVLHQNGTDQPAPKVR